MDSGYFCGYKIDCTGHNSTLTYGSDDYSQLERLGVRGLPGEPWMYYEWPGVNSISFLCMIMEGIPSDYRCPIDRASLVGKNGGLKQAPKPAGFAQHLEQLKAHPLWEYCKKKYGEDNTVLRWGSLLLIW